MTDTGNKDPGAKFSEWLNSANEFWGSMGKIWQDSLQTGCASATQDKSDNGGNQKGWESAFRMWRLFASVLAEPSFAGTFLKGINAMPDTFLKVAGTGLTGFLQFYQQWQEKAGRMGKNTKAYSFDHLDQEMFTAWKELYEQEIRQFLKIPQFGLLRGYQERFMEGLDDFNIFQSSMGEFIHLLSLPIEKSFNVLQQQLEELEKNGEFPSDPHEIYRLWVKILEGHFMTLFKSSEYGESLARALKDMGLFISAKDNFLHDVLQSLPIPTNKDMDELYKDLYLLKKKVKELDKKFAAGSK
ncbi:polyhydroxyalkanoate synthase subunit PhaE [Desulfosarcina sp. BuS5]|uniref:poly(R)-hydroxyalkanoic acid synthase subunit PhaE n=1 Tax=Desulfosarcina sp. BuS5 TaxID=933262 RepID=UPI000481616A|nr:poly(R)-hydroxyalkanoic acid synthase subunit PhaE [Desulfosarcina sp. BuS5]WDN90665.1 polyhydroxyalkanoate synthase subunit PhaE [Desulfosarcina sp. BuS5]